MQVRFKLMKPDGDVFGLAPMELKWLPRERERVTVTGYAAGRNGERLQPERRIQVALTVREVSHQIQDDGMKYVSGGGGIVEPNLDHYATVYLGGRPMI